jgi:hypothetical protein
MGDVVTTSNADGTKPGYILIDQLMEAMCDIREKNTGGYKLVLARAALVPFAAKYPMGGPNNDLFHADAGTDSTKTNCSLATLNAFMVGLARSSHESKPMKSGGKQYEVPLSGGVLVPNKFVFIWNMHKPACAGVDKLHMGAARALLKYNLGVRVKATHILRGDLIQMNWNDWTGAANEDAKWEIQSFGHSVICYHARRIPGGETRFINMSSQDKTNGVGVSVHPRSLVGLEDGAEKTLLKTPPKDLEGPEYIKAAITHGHWYLVTDTDADQDGAGKGTVSEPAGGYYRSQVARAHRPFPHFPIVLKETSARGGVSKATRTPAYSSLRDFKEGMGDLMAEIYYNNNEAGRGGFYPIGGTRTWHGGIHLYPDQDRDIVHAPLEGRLVCARLAPDDEESKKKWPLGSPNFILLKHRMNLNGKEEKFYSLLMHLSQDPWPAPGAPEADPRLRFPWLRDILLAPAVGSDLVTKFDWKKLYLKVVNACSLQNTSVNPPVTTQLAPGDILEIDPSKADELKAWYGTAAGGKATRKSDGKSGTLIAWAQDLVPVDVYPARYAELRQKLAKGDVVDLWKEELFVSAGEPIARVGSWSGKPTFHFEIFSEQFIKCWLDDETKVIKDTDTNLFIDRKAFTEKFFKLLDDAYPDNAGVHEHMVGTGAKKGDGVITRAEVIEFFNHSAEREAFRELVTYHLSEWSDAAEWDKLDDKGKEAFGFMEGPTLKIIKDQIAPYVWWSKNLKIDGLPKDNKTPLYYYHPIRFLMWIDYLRWKDAQGGGTDLHFSVFENLQKTGW